MVWVRGRFRRTNSGLMADASSMTRFVRTSAAEQALAAQIRQAVEDAAGGNRLLSRDETRRLPRFAQEAAEAVRAEKPAYARVYVDEVVDRATARAIDAMRQVNPAGGRDGLFLSQAEVRQVAKADPELGTMVRAAYMAGRSGPGQDRAVLDFLQRPGARALLHRRSRFGTTLDPRPGQPDRASVPPSVLDGFDHAHQAEARDVGSAVLKTFPLGGKPVYAVHLSTDGDDGHVELYGAKGEPLVSGRMLADRFLGPDPHFGLSRYAGPLAFSVPVVEGYSEDPERLERGQILSSWRPDATLARGAIEHDGIGVTRFEPDGLRPEHAEVARFVVELMYPRSLKYRADGPGPIDLARNAEIRVGTHTDPRDGQRYVVGDYKDIDDDSHTFYFQRTPRGVLKPMIDQYNN